MQKQQQKENNKIIEEKYTYNVIVCDVIAHGSTAFFSLVC